jgi:hypothetical protein
MGFLDKLIGAANKVEDVKTDIEYNTFRDRSHDRADQLEGEGAAIEGTVTGVHFTLNDSIPEGVYRVEWQDPEPRAAGVRYSGAAAPSLLRLGSSVPLRVDGDKAVVDTALLSGLAGAPSTPGRTARGAPETGVSDTSLSWEVLRHLEKWSPDRGTVVSLERVALLGLTTDNWDLMVTRSDGTHALVKRDFVPPYARWFVFPGATVPLAVDPKDPTMAQVDWPALATENSGGSWRDAPPDGSVAALALVKEAPQQAGSIGGGPIDLTVSAESAEAIEGVTLDQWALVEAALIQGRVPPGQYDEFATAHHGVPAGRWTAIKGQWEQRRNGDWKIGAAFGEAFEKSRKELKKKR